MKTARHFLAAFLYEYQQYYLTERNYKKMAGMIQTCHFFIVGILIFFI